MLEQKLSGLWWTRKISTVIYFIRELTGVVIAFYFLYFLIATEVVGLSHGQLLAMLNFEIATSVALAASLLHTITWLSVTTKVTPKPLPSWAQRLLFVGLIAIWLLISLLTQFLIYFPDAPF